MASEGFQPTMSRTVSQYSWLAHMEAERKQRDKAEARGGYNLQRPTAVAYFQSQAPLPKQHYQLENKFQNISLRRTPPGLFITAAVQISHCILHDWAAEREAGGQVDIRTLDSDAVAAPT